MTPEEQAVIDAAMDWHDPGDRDIRDTTHALDAAVEALIAVKRDPLPPEPNRIPPTLQAIGDFLIHLMERTTYSGADGAMTLDEQKKMLQLAKNYHAFLSPPPPIKAGDWVKDGYVIGHVEVTDGEVAHVVVYGKGVPIFILPIAVANLTLIDQPARATGKT